MIEMLVAAALLVVIMLGLLGMFYQVDRALRLGLQQRDILTAGRTAMEMMVRDLRMATASEDTNTVNLYAFTTYPGLVQFLEEGVANPQRRTNYIQPLILLRRENDQWHGIRYDVEEINGVATLYRWDYAPMSVTNPPAPIFHHAITNVAAVNYATAVSDNLNVYGRLAEGVVHLTMRCYDAHGVLITDFPRAVQADDIYQYEFRGTNMPAFVELEFGVLEPNVFRRAQEFTDGQAALDYLEDEAGAVQMFRERIPIRYVPPQTQPSWVNTARNF